MKNKKTSKILIVLLAIGLCLAAVGATKLTKVFINTFGKKEVAASYEEKELSSVVNDMYITILDDKANVVATTNPNTEVNPDYVFTETTEPVKKVKYSGKYLVLLEVQDTNSLDNKTLLKDNIVYSMTLPDYMVSYEGFDTDIEDNCYNFFSQNQVTACGGVYDDNVLKMIFTNTKDKYDVTFNYQFFVTFADGLKDTEFDIKTFDFGKYGSLQLYFEEAYPVINPSTYPGTNYNLSITQSGYKTSTNNYMNWNVNLSDAASVGKFNGSLELVLSDNMGLVVDKRTAYEYLDVYVDDVALSKRYTDDFDGCFYYDESDCLVSLTVTEDDNVFANTGTRQGGLLKKLVFDFGDNFTASNIKISFSTKSIITYNIGSASPAYAVSVKYNDREDEYALYESSKSSVISYSNPGSSFTVVGNETTQTGEIADSLKYTLSIGSSSKNYVYFDVSPNYSNSLQAYYYMNSLGFVAGSTDTSDSFTVKINDTDVTFERIDDINLSSLANEQLTKVDPAVQRQMSVIDSYNDNKSGNLHNILRSTTTNADGEYYWLVISKNTLNTANNNSDGTNLYDVSSTSELGNPASWRIYIFNIKNARVTVEWNQYLEKIAYNQSSISNYRYLRSYLTVNNYYGYYADYNSYLSNPVIIHTEQLNDFLKWDVVLDTNLIKVDDTFSKFNLNVFLPSYLTIINGKYYDVETNQITGEFDDTREQYETNKVIMCDQEVDNQINKCAHYTQFGDVDGTFASGGSTYFGSSYSRAYQIDGSNVEIDSDGLVHFIFFTKTNYNTLSSQNYDHYNGYVQIILDTPINEYDDASGFNDVEKKRIILSSLAGYVRPYYNVYDDGGSFDESGDSFENRNRYFTANTNIYTDFGGYVWGYGGSYYYTSNCGTDLTNIRNCSNKTLFNGNYRTFIGYKSNPIPSIIKSMRVVVDENYSTSKEINLGDLTFTDGIYDYCDNDSGICILIEDINEDGMVSGYNVDVFGLENTKTLRIYYSEFVDTYSLLTNNYGEAIYSSYQYIDPFKWTTTFNYNPYNFERSVYAVSDLAVESSANNASPTNDGLVINISDKVKAYKSDTDYIDIEGYLTRVRNIGLTETNNLEEIINIAEFKPYLSIDNVTITGVSNDGSSFDIYLDGNFLGEWIGSTITLLNDENNLYKLHLVSSNGEIHPSEIYVDYDLILSLDVREAAFYNGKRIGIYTNTKAAKEFECATCESEDDGNGNGYDAENQELYARAYTNQSDVVNYFSTSSIGKNGSVALFTVDYTAGDAGVSKPTNMEISDSVTVVDNFSGYSGNVFANLRSLYPKYSHYTNVVLHYGGEDIELPLETGTFVVNGGTGTITYSQTALNFSIDMPVETYGDAVSVTYSIDTDYSSLYAEAIENGWLTSQGKVVGYANYQTYEYSIYNTVTDLNTGKSDSSNGGSSIKITDVAPVINKSVSTINREEKKWEIAFNTGKDNREVVIEDTMTIEEDGKEEFYGALKNKDLVIKVGATTIYQNGTFTSGWDGTVSIETNGLNQIFTFKDTASRIWLANNSTVTITYNTYIDYTLLSGDTRVVDFHLDNKVLLTKGVNQSDNMSIGYYNYEYTYDVSKVYLGNGDDLTETNWKINVSSDKKRITNINLTDTNTLGDEFGDYLSISKFKIVLVDLNTNESTVLYDTDNNIDITDGITLGMADDSVSGLVLNTNGKYNFFANIAELPADSRIEIYYTLKVDKGAYISSGMMLDKELVINNRVQDNNNKFATAVGSGKIPSQLSKRYVSLGKDDDGYEIIRWTIDVNLADYYDLNSLVGKDVTITDEINDVFGLDAGTVTIRYLTINPSGNVVGNLVNSDLYELDTGDNRVQVKLLDTTQTPAIQISFTTKVVGSTHAVYNSVEIDVDNHKSTVEVEDEVTIFSPAVFGVVYSRDMLSYTIYARKLVDSEVSDKTFMFKITEVDESGNPIDGGYSATSTNGNEGRIEFNGLRYSRVGTYYYKVEEVIDENDKDLVYDNNVYIVKVVVVGNEDNTSYMVQSAEIVGGADEIVFNNKTPQEEKEEEPKNPNTKVFIGSIIAILLAISIFLFVKFYKKTNFLK